MTGTNVPPKWYKRTDWRLLSPENLRELLRRPLVGQRRVQDQPLLGLFRGIEDRMLEHHRADDGVVDRSASRAVARHLVLLPRLAELGAALAQRRDQLLELGVADVARAVGAELRHDEPRAVSPVGEHLPPPGIHEVQPDVIAGRLRDRSQIAEQRRGGVEFEQLIATLRK